jgi:hypothetical protein
MFVCLFVCMPCNKEQRLWYNFPCWDIKCCASHPFRKYCASPALLAASALPMRYSEAN